jgi:hypothetical protein
MRTRLTGAFARHYGEMVVVMLLGMGLLALPMRWATDALWPAVDPDDTTLMLARMAMAMTLPMTLEHVVMFAAMFAVMLARPEEYSHRRCERRGALAVG